MTFTTPVRLYDRMRDLVGPSVVVVVLAISALGQTSKPSASKPDPQVNSPQISPEARKLHFEALLIDTHMDTTQRLLREGWDFTERHAAPVAGADQGDGGDDPARNASSNVDLPRAREGGLDAAFFSIFVPGTVTGPEAVKRALVQIDAVRHLAERYPDRIVLATNAAEVRAAARSGRFAALMGMEGGHMIADDLGVLRDYARLGVRYLTLTHTVNTNWADSSTDKSMHNGLTDFGKDVVRELNRLGVIVDISHVADKTFWDALAVSQAPLLASHSSCRALSGHPRNMTDEMIQALAAKGGVIDINYEDVYLDDALYRAQQAREPEMEALRVSLEKRYPGPENAEKRRQELRAKAAALGPLPTVSWEKIVEHIDHVVKIAGIDHVGLGSDFDGATMPVGMEDATQLPKITDALLRKGYSPADIRKVLGGNVLRLMEQVDEVGRNMRAAASRQRRDQGGGAEALQAAPILRVH